MSSIFEGYKDKWVKDEMVLPIRDITLLIDETGILVNICVYV